MTCESPALFAFSVDRDTQVMKTLLASSMAGFWRMVLMPIDVCKTVLQVRGREGISDLALRCRTNGPLTLYHGSLAAFVSSVSGHLPWSPLLLSLLSS